jgi:hypothetical protein
LTHSRRPDLIHSFRKLPVGLEPVLEPIDFLKKAIPAMLIDIITTEREVQISCQYLQF